MFRVLARREYAPSALLALAEVLPRRQRADRDERVRDDGPSAETTLATRAPTPRSSTASSLLYTRFPSCHLSFLLLVYNFSADVGVFK